jgi:enterochelin esterase family protein
MTHFLALILWAASVTPATVLAPGMSLERILGPADEHIYTVELQSGMAVIGEADQEGVDLVVDVFGPDGKLLRQIDSPTGTSGPESIDFTALHDGTYRFVIHQLSDAPAGKYVMKVARVIPAAENAERLAAEHYPPAIFSLWKTLRSDPRAVEKFVAERKGKGPIVENISGDNQNLRVTYLYLGDESTEAVRVSGGPHGAVGGMPMLRFMKTPLFYASEIVPKDARYRYGFNEIKRHTAGPNDIVDLSEEIQTIDQLNPEASYGLSVMTMPDAPPQPYIVKTPSVPAGTLTMKSIRSAKLNEERPFGVYTPPGYDDPRSGSCDLLILFDGTLYGTGRTTLTPTPTIIDNLIAAKKVGPTVVLLINNLPGNRRSQDLRFSDPFGDFVATELVPWARSNYRIKEGPAHVVIGGSSYGGLAASYIAFRHPSIIGNVLSLSGSYWATAGPDLNPQLPYSAENGHMMDLVRSSERLPIRFYLTIGRFDGAAGMLATNRELRDLLLTKGYTVIYSEFDGGHDAISWRGLLGDGLIALIGATVNEPVPDEGAS